MRHRREGAAIEDPTPAARAGTALFELAPRLTRLENAILRDVTPPLTFRQYRILHRVAEGTTTLTALGRLATVTLPAVSESVDVIVRKNLLRRHTRPEDRRAVFLELTPAGRRALAMAQQLLEEAAEQILAEVPRERRDDLERDVRLVADRVTATLRAGRDPEAGTSATGGIAAPE